MKTNTLPSSSPQFTEHVFLWLTLRNSCFSLRARDIHGAWILKRQICLSPEHYLMVWIRWAEQQQQQQPPCCQRTTPRGETRVWSSTPLPAIRTWKGSGWVPVQPRCLWLWKSLLRARVSSCFQRCNLPVRRQSDSSSSKPENKSCSWERTRFHLTATLCGFEIHGDKAQRFQIQRPTKEGNVIQGRLVARSYLRKENQKKSKNLGSSTCSSQSSEDPRGDEDLPSYLWYQRSADCDGEAEPSCHPSCSSVRPKPLWFWRISTERGTETGGGGSRWGQTPAALLCGASEAPLLRNPKVTDGETGIQSCASLCPRAFFSLMAQYSTAERARLKARFGAKLGASERNGRSSFFWLLLNEQTRVSSHICSYNTTALIP